MNYSEISKTAHSLLGETVQVALNDGSYSIRGKLTTISEDTITGDGKIIIERGRKSNTIIFANIKEIKNARTH